MPKPPPPEPLIRKSVTLPESLWARVADYRLSQHIGSEMETIRRLVGAGLDAEARRVSREKR